jgi:glycosyltransferase involved in cell wall biosynthesis
MPYRPGAFAENANPLKLREYLACGKPVVSIPMPSVEPFRGLVQTAAGPEEFLAALETALATDSAAATQARMRAVERMSWDARVEEVIEIVQKHRNATG